MLTHAQRMYMNSPSLPPYPPFTPSSTHQAVRDGHISIAGLDDLELVPLHRQPGPPTPKVPV